MTDADQLLKQFGPKELKAITADLQVHGARFNPTGDLLAAGGYDGRVRLWNVSGEEPLEMESLTGHHAWVQAFAFSPDGHQLVSADSWGQIRVWSLDRDQPQLAWILCDAHEGWIRDVHFSPNGKRLVTCGRDRRIQVWSAMDGAFLFEVKGHQHDVYCSRFHPSGDWIVTGDDRGLIKISTASSGEPVRELDASVLYLEHRLQDVGGVRTLSFDRDGLMLAVGGTTPKNGGTVQGTPTGLLFDFESGKLKHTLGFGATTHCFVHDMVLHDAGFVMAVTSGTPGQGQIIFQRPDEENPFFLYTKIPNCHSISLHRPSGRFAVASTNRGSNGNGRRLNKDGEYTGNNSPIHLFQMPPS